MNETKNIPEKKFIAGPVTATIWQNQGRGRNGEIIDYRTVSFQRRYKDRNGVWQNSNSLRVNDLPKASLVLQKAYEFTVLKGAHENARYSEEVIEEVV